MHAGTKRNESSDFWDVVVIGAGLGGLTCAAYLARDGKRVLLLERASVAGGPCQTYTFREARFTIGTNTFGKHCSSLLKELDIPLSFEPAPLCLSYHGSHIYFPFRTSLFGAAKKLGLGLGEVFRLLPRLEAACANGKNYAEAVENFTNLPALRELLLAESWYIGTPPETLPAHALRVFFDRFYGYQSPIYPRNGAQAVPQALATYIERRGGKVQYDTLAQSIARDGNGKWFIETNDRDYSAACVVSNLPPKNTVELLKKGGSVSLDPQFTARIEQQHPALSFSALLLMLDRKNPFSVETGMKKKQRSSTLLLASAVSDSMKLLQQGLVPKKPIVNVVAPPCLDQSREEGLPVTVLTLWPKKNDSLWVDHAHKQNAEDSMREAVGAVLNDEWPGFLSAVKWSEYLTPEKYGSIMGGISSCPAHSMESSTEKPPCVWPIPGLYAVGTGVGPSGSHAAAAMESGRICAKSILSISRHVKEMVYGDIRTQFNS